MHPPARARSCSPRACAAGAASGLLWHPLSSRQTQSSGKTNGRKRKSRENRISFSPLFSNHRSSPRRVKQISRKFSLQIPQEFRETSVWRRLSFYRQRIHQRFGGGTPRKRHLSGRAARTRGPAGGEGVLEMIHDAGLQGFPIFQNVLAAVQKLQTARTISRLGMPSQLRSRISLCG